MFHAITTLRPRLVVWENVQGALSASAFSLMEPEQGHMGGRPTGPVLRALGRVLGDLAGIGYDATWTVVQASDVGAPHKRARVFVVAHPNSEPWLERWEPTTRETPGGRSWADVSGRDRTPRTLIPTPTASEGNLLPTPQATNATYSSAGYGANLHETAGTLRDSFGPYAPAIARWETITGRTAPAPTEPPLREGGKPRLSVRFVECLMGLPDGHVTGVGLSREKTLRALGNGVVPLQAAGGILRALQQERQVALEEGWPEYTQPTNGRN
jgi:DNA (cytosine-5)-methyltransferase 1